MFLATFQSRTCQPSGGIAKGHRDNNVHKRKRSANPQTTKTAIVLRAIFLSVRGTGNEHEARAPNLGYKAAHLQPRLIFDHNHLLRMSISSLDTDIDLCDIEVASVMSSPGSQQVPLARFENDELRPVLIEQADAPGKLCFYVSLTVA